MNGKRSRTPTGAPPPPTRATATPVTSPSDNPRATHEANESTRVTLSEEDRHLVVAFQNELIAHVKRADEDAVRIRRHNARCRLMTVGLSADDAEAYFPPELRQSSAPECPVATPPPSTHQDRVVEATWRDIAAQARHWRVDPTIWRLVALRHRQTQRHAIRLADACLAHVAPSCSPVTNSKELTWT